MAAAAASLQPNVKEMLTTMEVEAEAEAEVGVATAGIDLMRAGLGRGAQMLRPLEMDARAVVLKPAQAAMLLAPGA